MNNALIADARDAGLTVRMTDGFRPSEGWAVSLDSLEFGDIVAESVFFADGGDSLADYVARHADMLASGAYYLGIWHESEAGRVHLDLSVVLGSESDALELARMSDQIAVYAIHTGETIYLD